ncbi:MAG: hypothetical protein H6959_01460 [Chromatiaceae bacterium]|nr:hypothetical protein [Chromatiaceae bacterium]
MQRNMINASSPQPGIPLFTTPETAVARHPGTILNPREQRAWIDSLPFGNPPHAAQLLLQQLRLLVRDPEPGAKFGALLDSYQIPVWRLYEIASERDSGVTGNLVPLDQLEHALLELLTEMGLGYLRIANGLLLGGKAPAPELLYRAGALLDNADHIERRHFGATSTRHWASLLTIYQYADGAGIVQTAIPATHRQAGDPADIAGLLFRALMMGLCDPNHVAPQHVVDWHTWIGGHTEHLELGILPQGPFSIPVDVSGALSPLAGARRGKPGPSMRYLIADSFLRALHDDPDAPEGLYETLGSLIKGRKLPEQRQSPRQERSHPFRLSVGLHDVHARLSALTSGPNTAQTGTKTLPCVQKNQSKTGAAFYVTGTVATALSIGEVLLAETDNPRPGGAPVGFVGRIRRLVTDHAGQIEIGVEKLSGHLMPVTISGAVAERARGDCAALLQRHAGADKLVLIVPRSAYRENDTATAEYAGGHYSLRMRRLIDDSPRIALIDVFED